jgi:hypothetical protein
MKNSLITILSQQLYFRKQSFLSMIYNLLTLDIQNTENLQFILNSRLISI